MPRKLAILVAVATAAVSVQAQGYTRDGLKTILYAVRLLTTLAIFEALQDFLQTHIDLPGERFTTAFLDESLATPAKNGQPYRPYCSS